MAHVRVLAARLAGGRIEQLTVEMPGLPSRSIDRDTAIRWMRDGHSMIPVGGGSELPALRLAETPDEAFFIRKDTANEPSDSLPELPGI